MLGFIFMTLGSLLLVPLLLLAKAQRKQNLTGALPRAVAIAAAHGWVSAGRLMALSDLKEKDAKDTLAEGCRQGLLFRGGDGRYYVKQTSLTSNELHQEQ